MGLIDPQLQVQSVRNTTSSLMKDASWEVMVSDSNCILKAKHCVTGIICKFSFGDGFGREKSFFMKYLLDLQPNSRKLIYFAKIWLMNHNIQMNGYLLTTLVIFFLQKERLLPSVRKVQENPAPYMVGSEFQIFFI